MIKNILMFGILMSGIHYYAISQIAGPDTANGKKANKISLTLKSRAMVSIQKNDVGSDDYNELCERAQTYFETEKYTEAYVYFNKANAQLQKLIEERYVSSKLQHFDVAPLYNMAMCKSMLGEKDSSMFLLRKVLDLNPSFYAAFHQIGAIYLSYGKTDSAKIYFEKAIQLNARCEEAYYNLAYIYYLRGQRMLAKDILFKLITYINPKMEMAYLLYGAVNESGKELTEAEKNYTRAIKANPASDKGYQLRGILYLKQKLYAKAAADLRKNYELNMDDEEAMYTAASAEIYNNQVQVGIEMLIRVYNLSDTSSGYFKLNFSHAEAYDLMVILNNKQLPEKEQQAALQLFRLAFMDANAHINEIRKLINENMTSVVCQRLYFLSLYDTQKYDEFMYQIFRLYNMDKSLPNIYMLEASTGPASITLEKRIACIEKAISLDSVNPAYYFVQAMFYSELGERNRTYASLNKALQLDKNFAAAHISLGSLYENERKYDSALVQYKTAISENGGEIHGCYAAGNCYLETSQEDSAVVYLTKAIELGVNDPEIFLNRAQAWWAIGKYENAHKDLDTACRLRPSYEEAIEFKIFIYTDQKRYRDALLLAGKMTKTGDQPIYWYGVKGDICYEAGDYEKALVAYDEAISISPSYMYVLERIGKTFYALNDTATGKIFFKKAIESIESHYTDAYLMRAKIYGDMGEFEESNKLIGYELKGDTTIAEAWGYMGLNYYRMGDFKSSITYSEKAVQFDSTALFARYNIALSELRLGNVDKAKQLYARCVATTRRKHKKITQDAIQDLRNLADKGIYKEESLYIINTILTVPR